jgi:hypothetical protein
MSTIEDFRDLANKTAEHFKLSQDAIHVQVIALIVPGVKDEVVRFVFDETVQKICMSFHVSTNPTDAIQIFAFVKHQFNEILLLDCYYPAAGGTTYSGIDAQIMLEQERQNAYLKIFQARTQKEEAAEWQLEQLQKNGKITFH